MVFMTHTEDTIYHFYPIYLRRQNRANRGDPDQTAPTKQSDQGHLYFTATNPAPSSHIPVGLNFLFHNFESRIEKSGNVIL